MGGTEATAHDDRVGVALLPLTALDTTWLWKSLLWLALVLAVYSGWQYLWRSRPSNRSPFDRDVAVTT